MLSEAVTRKIIGAQGAEVLIDVIEGAWDDHLAENRLRTPWTQASIVWDYMENRAKDAFVDAEGVRQVTRLDRSMFVMRERFLLRFKKHSRELQTSNYPTASQRGVAGQGYFGEYPALQAVSCGYALDKANAGIESLVIVNHIDGWSIDLRELAAGQLAPVTQLLDFVEYEENLIGLESITWPNASGAGS